MNLIEISRRIEPLAQTFTREWQPTERIIYQASDGGENPLERKKETIMPSLAPEGPLMPVGKVAEPKNDIPEQTTSWWKIWTRRQAKKNEGREPKGSTLN